MVHDSIRVDRADGRVERVRKRSTELLSPLRLAKEVPTLAEYADEFQKTYVLANNKPSEREAKACILKHHLLPAFGRLPLDAIRTHAIERSRRACSPRSCLRSA